MYEDSPDHRLYKEPDGCPLYRPPRPPRHRGEVSDIQKIDRDLLEQCYRMFYNPSNMVLVVAGDIDPKTAFEVADRTLNGDGFKPRG